MNLCVRLTCIFPLILPLFACSMEDPNLEELRRLCEKDAGVNIYRTVDAKGYHNASLPITSFLDLIKSDFEFIEFCEDKPQQKELLQEPGCGRLIRVPKGSGRCHPWLQQILDESYPEPYVRFRQDYCVEFELLDTPEARYFYQSEIDPWVVLDGGGQLRRDRVWITDIVTSEVMGEYINYTLKPRPTSMIYKDCHNIDETYPTYVEAELLNRTLSR